MEFSGDASHEGTDDARDGVRLATGGEDGVLRVWDVSAAESERRCLSDLQMLSF